MPLAMWAGGRRNYYLLPTVALQVPLAMWSGRRATNAGANGGLPKPSVAIAVISLSSRT